MVKKVVEGKELGIIYDSETASIEVRVLNDSVYVSTAEFFQILTQFIAFLFSLLLTVQATSSNFFEVNGSEKEN